MTSKTRTVRKIALIACQSLCFLLLALFVSCRPASAQFIGYTSPQTVQQVAFSAVTPTPGAVFVTSNIGANMHFFSYTITTPANMLAFDCRLEGSSDGTNFFPISEESTAVNSGSVYAVGYYPVVRVRILDFQTSGGSTITGSYVGTSSTAGPLLGTYSFAQQFNKTLFTEVAASANQTANITSPTGSAQGYVLVFAPSGGSLPANSSVAVQILNGSTFVQITANNALSTTLPAVIPVPDARSQQLRVIFTSGGASATILNGYYFFVPPGIPSELNGPGLQPISTSGTNGQLNKESTSAANAAVTVSTTTYGFGRVNLFSVSARCSAGTAQLQVKDGVGGTVIWSTAAGEVGTTTFKYQWNPALASSIGSGMDVVLGTCGGGNTGTLDVQLSQF